MLDSSDAIAEYDLSNLSYDSIDGQEREEEIIRLERSLCTQRQTLPILLVWEMKTHSRLEDVC